MQWVKDHWQMIAIVVGVMINVINAASSHFTEVDSRARKILLFVVEMLAIVTSQGARVGDGPLSRLKLPLQSVPPIGPRLVQP